jgi:hypothetical protein
MITVCFAEHYGERPSKGKKSKSDETNTILKKVVLVRYMLLYIKIYTRFMFGSNITHIAITLRTKFNAPKAFFLEYLGAEEGTLLDLSFLTASGISVDDLEGKKIQKM